MECPLTAHTYPGDSATLTVWSRNGADQSGDGIPRRRVPIYSLERVRGAIGRGSGDEEADRHPSAGATRYGIVAAFWLGCGLKSSTRTAQNWNAQSQEVGFICAVARPLPVHISCIRRATD
ncbi:hypothetical protein PFICI_14515 [Pestalotiopsis fici W106-1]|uniref:Uncharacterized protein n=1 Tax=Pestalotiopsis fici (strain W106-1 / CGMCC3.15140) TaxID=1229662 RepID=W3WIG1_PESFW|nr:uncharacterized protein PFICI_14515 [Pestalotiopsis fici W106-1]ETS73569.1 hypothetical protein PFICI_14515 [Pestalotiopsis fici W106-1]